MIYFKLFNGCRLVEGAFNCLIYDLERPSNSNIIPKSLYEILTTHAFKSIEEIKKCYKNEFDLIIDEYFDFLIKNEFIFYCTFDELLLFPTVNFEWESSKIITNSIIDFDGTVEIKDFKNYIEELSALGCEAVQFRSFISIKLNKIKELLLHFENTSITSVELLLKYEPTVTDNDLLLLRDSFPRITEIKIYNSALVSSENISHFKYNPDIENDCGIVSSNFFSISFETFSESQCHNTCLNRKISIDKKGYIKGCPSMRKNFGKINETPLNLVVNSSEFTKFWNISKNEIEVCKDCEFRFCCTDCRVFIDNVADLNSRPSKCNYNPYQGLWKGEVGFIDVNEWKNKK